MFASTRASWGHLADDVLREIFLWCIHVQSLAHPILTSYKLKSCRLPQLSVSRVCSTWRRVALYTPRLWTEIWIEFLTDQNMFIAGEWLSRARSLPVLIRISFIGQEDEARWQTALTDFLSSYRPEYLCFPLDATRLLHQVLSDLPLASVAGLKTLDLTNSGEYGGTGFLEVDDTRFPELSYLSLQGKWRLSPRSNALRIIHADSVPLRVTRCWDILRGFPSLEECKLTVAHDTRLTMASAIVSAPRLRNFQVYFRLGTSFGRFIAPLSLPSLEKFEVYESAIEWSTEAFFSMAQQSNFFPHLDKLVIKKCRNVLDANLLLEILHSLTSLALCEGYGVVSLNNETLEGLACGRLGPRIEKIELGHLPDVNAFLDMAESRLRNARTQGGESSEQEQFQFVPFTRVAFSAPTLVRRAISGRLESLYDQGLDIVVFALYTLDLLL